MLQSRTPAARILVVEDEPEYRAMLRGNLEAEGYQVATAPDGPTGLDRHRGEPADVILLDLMLPGMDGLQVLRSLRSGKDSVPVLMITARSEPGIRLRAIEAGVNDFLTKPFSLSDLLLRVERLVCRARAFPDAVPEPVLASGPFRLDLEAQAFSRRGEVLDVGLHGLRILAVLIPGTGRLHSRQELMARVWGAEEHPGGRTMDAAMALIWQALGNDRGWLSSVGGLAFRWQPPHGTVHGPDPGDSPCPPAT